VEKSGVLEHKIVDIISETPKDRLEEKLLWKAYRNSFERYHPKSIRPPLPQHWWFATPTQNSNRDYFRNELQLYEKNRTTATASATNFKFCKHIHRIDWNKSPLKISKIFRAPIYRAHSSTFLCIDKFTHVMFRFRRHISVSNNK